MAGKTKATIAAHCLIDLVWRISSISFHRAVIHRPVTLPV